MMIFFDLDGTLIDSNGVWVTVDLDFLARRGLELTPEYSYTVGHSIFPVAAQFTKDYYHLDESPEAIMKEWRDMAYDAYAGTIPLKPGARELLDKLKGEGRSMALLTAGLPELAKAALETEDELSLVEGHLIPALDKVGEGYERGKVFLPQLLSAAQAAQSVFEVIRASIARKGGAPVKKGRLVVATVKGDIHDIGKNIVKTVLENYGYEVLDLGRDVPPETILKTVQEQDIRLVGLSALMTTTLPAMEETIRLLQTLPEPPITFVGGAVVTPEYARQMGADYYAKDARQSVEIARKVIG